MWYEILKEDLKKRKGINLILFFFIILSTIFLASSVSNIHLVLNGLNNYMELANVTDFLVMLPAEEETRFEDWLRQRKEVTEYGKEELCRIVAKDVQVVKDEKEQDFKEQNVELFLGYTGSDYFKPLDSDGEDLVVESGEVALPAKALQENNLEIGDTLTLTVGEKTYTYTIAQQCKDIVYGSEASGVERFAFCKSDYDNLTAQSDNASYTCFAFNTDNMNETRKALDRSDFSILISLSSDMYALLYVFNMVLAGLLILVGICLILISLLILRFSIVFTLEENYQEIGVMKAIGMRNFTIRSIYLIKYLVIVGTGAAVGFVLSIPVGNWMVRSVSESMALGNASGTLILNFVCSLVIILFVMGMCLLFTGRMKKVSAIEAIRGNNGERYSKRRGLNLYTKKYMGTIVFLGLNDVLCNIRRYLILLIAFCISFVLITIPLNTLTTMTSDEMVEKFDLDTGSAVYMDIGFVGYDDIKELQQKLNAIKEDMEKKGYAVELSTLTLYALFWSDEDIDMSAKIQSLYPVDMKNHFMKCDEGEMPVLENEVAFSKTIMERYHLKIGDTIRTTIGGEEKKFVITGSYTDYLQMGESARLSEALDMTGERIIGTWKIMVYMDTELSGQELADKMQEEFPEYDWLTAQEVVDDNVGSIQDNLRAMQLPMTLMLCVLIMLVSIFMLKLFMVREKGQFAMLKSIGFTNRCIRLWLIMRMVWLTGLSMLFSIPLSMLSNRFILTPIFGIMGARLKIQVDPLKAYLIYPGILLIGILTAAVYATKDVKKMTTRDMSNIE